MVSFEVHYSFALEKKEAVWFINEIRYSRLYLIAQLDRNKFLFLRYFYRKNSRQEEDNSYKARGIFKSDPPCSPWSMGDR